MNEKVALVTGGASGIGKAVGEAFTDAGAKVVVSDIDDDAGEQVAEQLSGKTEAIYLSADVSQPEQLEDLVNGVVDEFGRLDYAVNNAGIGGAIAPTADYEIDEWNRVVSINLSSVFYSMKYEIPAMLESDGGAIVNMASILGKVGFQNSGAYVAAKHGVVGLTKTTAMEYAQQSIRVTAVCPGFIQTPLISDLEEDPETLDMLIGLHPIGRLGQPEEVANLAVWLCSDEASFITGSAHLVDGGYTVR